MQPEAEPQEAAPKRRPKWVKGFLAHLALTGNVGKSCEAVGIDRGVPNRYRAQDSEFSADWEEALDAAADRLEAEALRRAHDGVDEPVFGSLGGSSGTGQVGVIRKYSDTLLIFLLKGARPEKFRERQDVKLAGTPGGAPITVNVTRVG